MVCDAHNERVLPDLPADVKAVVDRLRELLSAGRTEEALDLFALLLLRMREENQSLAQRVAQLMRQHFGRRSEKLDPNQLALALEQMNESAEASPAVEAPEPEPAKPEDDAPLPAPKPKPVHPGRKPLPADLPRERRELLPPQSELTCGKCGKAKVKIGEEVSEVLELVPAQFKVIQNVRPKFACQTPGCESGLCIAPAADKVIEKGLPGPGLLAHLLVSKYQDHLPLNRQAGIYRPLGVDLSNSTLGDRVKAGAEALVRIAQEIERCVLASAVVGLDDTGIPVLDRESENGVKKGHLWVFVGDEPWVAFRYFPTWSSGGVRDFLAGYQGILQGDGYAGYDKLVAARPNELRLAGCMAHARRKFYDAMQAGDPLAPKALEFIRELYRIEDKARETGADPDRLLALRQLYSRPVMDEWFSWVAKTYPLAVPKSPLGKALTYVVNQGPSLRLFLQDDRVAIDNNRVERALRTVAVGRKNYLFAGSDKGAERTAILYTVLGTAKLAGAEPLA